MANYNWSVNIPPLLGVPMFDYNVSSDLPSEFHPRGSYTKRLLELVVLLQENFKQKQIARIKKITQEQLEDITYLSEMHARVLKSVIFNKDMTNTPALKNEYVDLYKKVTSFHDTEYDPDLASFDSEYKTIEKPIVSNFMYDDDFFAYWRLSGNNPLAIKGVDKIPEKIPLTNEIYKKVMGGDDDLTQALSENRIYIIDYGNLDGATAENGVSKPESEGASQEITGYSYMAIALFAVSRETKKLKSLAIQCGQSSDDNNPLFVPSIDENYRWGWEMAKLVVHSADKAEHQLCHHLGTTHLMSEVFALATIRNFRTEHPLYRLLISHIEGTNRINHNALLALLGPQKFVDNLIAAELGSLAQKTIDIRLSYDFYENFLPRNLSLRKVDDVNALPDYPYRDDGLLIWNAISKWVSEYIKLTYPSDLEINCDENLQSWMRDIVDNGLIKNFRVMTTREELAEALTMIIFTMSAQHAAVNFPQNTHMMYAPAMVGTLAAQKPVKLNGYTKKDWLSMLPGQSRSTAKIEIYTLLAGIHNGFLGEYVYVDGSEIFKEEDDELLYSALTNFRDNLKKIEGKISMRNKKRPYSYETLMPSNIPASVNI